PGPAASMANNTRAAVVARALALMALDGTGAGDQMLMSASARQTTSSGPAQAHVSHRVTHAAATSSVAALGTDAGSGAGNAGSNPWKTSAQSSSLPANALPPTAGDGHRDSGTTPSGSEGNQTQARLAPIAHVWLIVLPYGQSFAGVLGQGAA